MGEKPASQQGPKGAYTDLGQDRAHSARMYDYFLGGKTNYAVDREAARQVIRAFPAVEIVAKVNRAYMHRAIRYLARKGIRQFIDVGTGIPTTPNVHEVAQRVSPDCNVVYVDNDPIVLVYADELLDGTPQGRTAYVEADAARPEEIWDAVRDSGVIDLERPIALSLHALMHFFTDEREPYDIVRRLLEPLPSGSYLSLSHCTAEFDPEAWQAISDTYTERGTPLQLRGLPEIRRFFDDHGLELEDPGVVLAHRWHPEVGSGPCVLTERQVATYAGIARKP